MFFFNEVRKQRSVKAAEYHDTITKHQAAPINIIMHDLIENFFSVPWSCLHNIIPNLFISFASSGVWKILQPNNNELSTDIHCPFSFHHKIFRHKTLVIIWPFPLVSPPHGSKQVLMPHLNKKQLTSTLIHKWHNATGFHST